MALARLSGESVLAGRVIDGGGQIILPRRTIMFTVPTWKILMAVSMSISDGEGMV